MKNKFVSFLEVFSPMLLVLGDLGLFFESTMAAGFVLFALGCVSGLAVLAVKGTVDVYERFHLLAIVAGLMTLGLFAFTGIIYTIIVALIILFTIDFLITVLDLRQNGKQKKERINASEKPSQKTQEYPKYNEEKLLDELDSIQDEFSKVQIYDSGNIGDIEDFSLRKKAEQIKEEIEKAVIVQDPKEGRFFYKENGKMFHLKGCSAIQRVNKKELKAANSRTELLAKGYKACKICNA